MKKSEYLEIQSLNRSSLLWCGFLIALIIFLAIVGSKRVSTVKNLQYFFISPPSTSLYMHQFFYKIQHRPYRDIFLGCGFLNNPFFQYKI